MGASRKSRFSFQDDGGGDLNPRDDKFKLVSCPRNALRCRGVLPQVNQLYSESELARINKEYQRSIELLQQAYYKTLELNQPTCENCVKLFHSSIKETLETLHKEINKNSSRNSGKKRMQLVYSKMVHFFEKLNLSRISEAGN